LENYFSKLFSESELDEVSLSHKKFNRLNIDTID